MGTNIGGVSIGTSRVRVQFALTYILHLSQLPCVFPKLVFNLEVAVCK